MVLARGAKLRGDCAEGAGFALLSGMIKVWRGGERYIYGLLDSFNFSGCEGVGEVWYQGWRVEEFWRERVCDEVGEENKCFK